MFLFTGLFTGLIVLAPSLCLSLLVTFFLFFSLFLLVSINFFLCSYLINVGFINCLKVLFICSFLSVGWFDFFFPLISLFFPSVLCGLWCLGAPAISQVLTSKMGDKSLGHWLIREHLTPWNTNQQKCSQRTPSQH